MEGWVTIWRVTVRVMWVTIWYLTMNYLPNDNRYDHLLLVPEFKRRLGANFFFLFCFVFVLHLIRYWSPPQKKSH